VVFFSEISPFKKPPAPWLILKQNFRPVRFAVTLYQIVWHRALFSGSRKAGQSLRPWQPCRWRRAADCLGDGPILCFGHQVQTALRPPCTAGKVTIQQPVFRLQKIEAYAPAPAKAFERDLHRPFYPIFKALNCYPDPMEAWHLDWVWSPDKSSFCS
jgi:hypothetical protein